jgi:hypothetical protein
MMKGCGEEQKDEEEKEQRQWPGRETRVQVISKPESVDCLPGKITLFSVILQNGTKWPWNKGH